MIDGVSPLSPAAERMRRYVSSAAERTRKGHVEQRALRPQG
jgi:hypothetical protein